MLLRALNRVVLEAEKGGRGRRGEQGGERGRWRERVGGRNKEEDEG